MTTVGNDNFTGTPSDNLQSHTSDSGDSWTKSADSGADVIIGATGGRVGATTLSAAARALFNAIPTSADYTVSATFQNVFSTADNYPAIYVRADDADPSTHYQLYWRVTTSQLVLRRTVAGTGSDLVTVTLDGSTSSVNVSLTVIGADLSFTIDAVDAGDYTDPTPITGRGRAGLSFFPVGTGNAQFIDNFSVTEADAPGSLPVLLALLEDDDND